MKKFKKKNETMPRNCELMQFFTAQVTAQVISFCKQPRKAREIMNELGLKHWKTFQTNYLKPLLDAELIEMTIPDKPTSRLQKYRLAIKGLEAQSNWKGLDNE